MYVHMFSIHHHLWYSNGRKPFVWQIHVRYVSFLEGKCTIFPSFCFPWVNSVASKTPLWLSFSYTMWETLSSSLAPHGGSQWIRIATYSNPDHQHNQQMKFPLKSQSVPLHHDLSSLRLRIKSPWNYHEITQKKPMKSSFLRLTLW